MLPFLKDRHEGGMSGPDEIKKMGPEEEDEDYGLLDAVVEDMIDAVHKKDKKLLKGALEALCEYIEDKDKVQDEEIVEE